VNERERLFQRFDRVQKLENSVCLAVGIIVFVFVRLYKVFFGQLLDGPSWIIPVIVVPVLAKFAFALWSARLARAMKVLAAEEKIPAARVTQTRRRTSNASTTKPSNIVLPPPLVSQQPAWGDTSVQDGAVIGRRGVADGTSARTEPS
jgi:hypothetical protein